MTLRRVVLVLVLAWFIVGTWLTSDGGTSITELLGLPGIGIVLGVGWLVDVILAARTEKSLAKILKPSLIVIPLVLTIGVGVHWFEAALPLRFAASQPSLERYAKSASARKLNTRATTRVGLFSIKETEVLENDVVRLITAQCMMDDCGFVYSPNGMPPRIGEDTYVQVTDDWFRWDRSW